MTPIYKDKISETDSLEKCDPNKYLTRKDITIFLISITIILISLCAFFIYNTIDKNAKAAFLNSKTIPISILVDNQIALKEGYLLNSIENTKNDIDFMYKLYNKNDHITILISNEDYKITKSTIFCFLGYDENEQFYYLATDD